MDVKKIFRLTEESAYALKIGSRYYYSVSKNEKVLTAWTLAGATLHRSKDSFTYPIKMLKGKRPYKIVKVQEVALDG